MFRICDFFETSIGHVERDMDNEIKITENEFHDAVELHQSEENLGSYVNEFFEDAKEFEICGEEFFEMKSSGEEPDAEAEKKAKRKKRHEKLTRKMSYLVASTVAVIALSNTLGNSIGSNVTQAGGSINGDLRFSIQWNGRNDNKDDLDAHCVEPGGYEIYYGNAGTQSPAGGCLDIDITQPGENVAVENIIYKSRKDMEEGTYQLKVHCYAEREGNGGFSAEVQIQGRTYKFKHTQDMEWGETVVVAEVVLKNGRLKLQEHNEG